MKMMINDSTCNPSNARGAPGRAGAILAWLALVLTVPTNCLTVQAFVISNNAVLLSWPEPATEQIVIGASSLASNAVWSPWPEPIFKRSGQLCMAVPATEKERYFKLVPGTQFVDDFSATWGPFTNRNSWRPFYNEGTDKFIATNGVLQLNWHGPIEGGFGLRPPGPDIQVRDFYMSLDVLDWVTSGANWSMIGLIARGNLAYNWDYGGGLLLNYGGVRGRVAPDIWFYTTETFGPSFDIQQIPPPYRLQFWGVGPKLHFRVLSLTTGQILAELTLTHSAADQGFVCLWISAPSGGSESHSITVDNFFVTGTRP